ncbi:unnamed protein product, partial [Allacma fusca]
MDSRDLPHFQCDSNDVIVFERTPVEFKGDLLFCLQMGTVPDLDLVSRLGADVKNWIMKVDTCATISVKLYNIWHLRGQFFSEMLIHALLFVAALLTIYNLFWLKRNKLPPGPSFCLPILGHLPFLAGKNPTRSLLNISKIYGPILHVRLGSYGALVIHDSQLIRKAFNMNAFAGRANIKLFDKISGNRRGLAFSDDFQKLAVNVSTLFKMSTIMEKLAVFLEFIPDWFPEISGVNDKIRVEKTSDPESTFFAAHKNIT